MLSSSPPPVSSPFFFFNDTATTEIYTLSLHDALPIWPPAVVLRPKVRRADGPCVRPGRPDRKSTRLNSSHSQISYAVFCLKKKKSPAFRKSVNKNGYPECQNLMLEYHYLYVQNYRPPA